jgi:hypothetical protein
MLENKSENNNELRSTVKDNFKINKFVISMCAQCETVPKTSFAKKLFHQGT